MLGQLGLDPDRVPDLERVALEARAVTEGVELVTAGRFSTCIVTLEGAIRCTGQNAQGQLGRGGSEAHFEFADVELPSAADAIK